MATPSTTELLKNNKTKSDDWEVVKGYLLGKRAFRDRYRDKHLDLVVKNLEHIRQFTTQLMLVAGSLAVLSSAGIGSGMAKVRELYDLGLVYLLAAVGYGAVHLKSVLEKENNALKREGDDYIAHFSQLTKAEDRILIERTPESVENYFKVMREETERVMGLQDQREQREHRPDISLTIMVTLLCAALSSIAISLIIDKSTLQKLFRPLFDLLVILGF